jgi:hypothetical protein
VTVDFLARPHPQTPPRWLAFVRVATEGLRGATGADKALDKGARQGHKQRNL